MLGQSGGLRSLRRHDAAGARVLLPLSGSPLTRSGGRRSVVARSDRPVSRRAAPIDAVAVSVSYSVPITAPVVGLGGGSEREECAQDGEADQ
jgi:hypothetical protein